MQKMVPECATVTNLLPCQSDSFPGVTSIPVPDSISTFWMAFCLKCCDNLLGILLRHPSRAAATRGKNVETSEYIHAPSYDSAFHEQSTHYQQAAATSGCDIDILHGLRQRVATRGYIPHLWWTSGET